MNSTISQLTTSETDDGDLAVETTTCGIVVYDYVDFTQLSWVRIIFIVLYSLSTAISVVGNLFVITTVFTNKHMRTVTNYYIVNLAAADLLVALFVMPLKCVEFLAPCSWPVFAHDSLCSALMFTLPVFVFASVLTLVAITLERFYAIVYPLKAKIISGKSRTRKIIASTWLVALIVATPYLYGQSYPFTLVSQHGVVERQTCTDRFDDIDRALYGGDATKGGFRRGYFLFLFVVMYVCPSAVILYTCVHITLCLLKSVDTERKSEPLRKLEETKRKVARMIILVAALFFLSWAPFYIVNVIHVIQEVSFLTKSNFVFTSLLTHLVGFINSGVNPFIYCYFSEKFCSSFRRMTRGLVCRLLGALRYTLCCRPFVKTHSRTCHRCAAQLMSSTPGGGVRMSWRTRVVFHNSPTDFQTTNTGGISETEVTYTKRQGMRMLVKNRPPQTEQQEITFEIEEIN